MAERSDVVMPILRTRRGIPFWLLVCASCGSDPSAAPDRTEVCEGERFPVAHQTARCEGAEPGAFCPAVPAERCTDSTATLDRDLGLRLRHSLNVGGEVVAGYAGELARYFSAQALRFWTAGEPEPIELAYVLNGSLDQIFEALDEHGIDLARELTAEERTRAQGIIDEIVWGPVVEFLTGQAGCGCSVDFVVLDGIVAPGLRALFPEVVLVGFGTSPSGPAHDSSFAQSLVPLLRGRAYDPAVFLGHADIEAAGLPHAAIAAHELGHALGLPHDEAAGNLMQSAVEVDCEAQLDAAQAAILREALDGCRRSGPEPDRTGGETGLSRAGMAGQLLSRLIALDAARRDR